MVRARLWCVCRYRPGVLAAGRSRSLELQPRGAVPRGGVRELARGAPRSPEPGRGALSGAMGLRCAGGTALAVWKEGGRLVSERMRQVAGCGRSVPGLCVCDGGLCPLRGVPVSRWPPPSGRPPPPSGGAPWARARRRRVGTSARGLPSG